MPQEVWDMTADRPWQSPIKERAEDLLREFVARADELLDTQERINGLLGAVVALAEDLSLEAVLDRVVQSACVLVGAKYGALGVIGQFGEGLGELASRTVQPGDHAVPDQHTDVAAGSCLTDTGQ